MPSTVTGYWSGSGRTSLAEKNIIRITPVFEEGTVVEDSQRYLFVTYDSSIRVMVDKSGAPYVIAGSDNEALGELGTQTAVLLRLSGDAGIDQEVVLSMVMEPGAPVGWRAGAVVMSGGHVSAGPVRWVNSQGIPSLKTGQAGVLFFGHPGTGFTYTDTSMTQIIELVDGGHHIEGLTWTADAQGMAVNGGPWFTAQVVAFIEPPVIGEGPGGGEGGWIETRPPPVSADTFWAYPAACQAADVFLINNDKLAETWDVPTPDVFAEGDTLLLNHTDSDGTRWSLTDIDGWWTLPDPDLPDLPRPGYLDGSFPVDGRYKARSFTVSGAFLPGPHVSVAVPRQRLLRALDAVRGGALFVAKEPVWPKQSWVYLEGQPKVTTTTVNQLTLFEFTLKAVDPIKYEAGTAGLHKTTIYNASVVHHGRHYRADEVGGAYTQESVLRGMRFREGDADPTDIMQAPNPFRRYDAHVKSGKVLLMNSGTTKVFPRFYIYGECTDPVITNLTTGQQMVFEGTISAAEMLVVDCYWRAVMLRPAEADPPLNPISDVQGQSARDMLDFKSQWIGLIPGPNLLVVDASVWSDTAKVVVVHRCGWLG